MHPYGGCGYQQRVLRPRYRRHYVRGHYHRSTASSTVLSPHRRGYYRGVTSNRLETRELAGFVPPALFCCPQRPHAINARCAAEHSSMPLADENRRRLTSRQTGLRLEHDGCRSCFGPRTTNRRLPSRTLRCEFFLQLARPQAPVRAPLLPQLAAKLLLDASPLLDVSLLELRTPFRLELQTGLADRRFRFALQTLLAPFLLLAQRFPLLGGHLLPALGIRLKSLPIFRRHVTPALARRGDRLDRLSGPRRIEGWPTGPHRTCWTAWLTGTRDPPGPPGLTLCSAAWHSPLRHLVGRHRRCARLSGPERYSTGRRGARKLRRLLQRKRIVVPQSVLLHRKQIIQIGHHLVILWIELRDRLRHVFVGRVRRLGSTMSSQPSPAPPPSAGINLRGLNQRRTVSRQSGSCRTCRRTLRAKNGETAGWPALPSKSQIPDHPRVSLFREIKPA